MNPETRGTVRAHLLSRLGVLVMSEVVAVAFALAVPFLCLGLLLWLARLEDTLTEGLETPRATAEPAPQSTSEAPAAVIAA